MSQTSKLGNHATRVVKEKINSQEVMTVYYHATPVVRWNDEAIVLKNNGWFSPTTKTRMNQAANQFKLPYTVYQKDWAWFIVVLGCKEPFQFTDPISIILKGDNKGIKHNFDYFRN